MHSLHECISKIIFGRPNSSRCTMNANRCSLPYVTRYKRIRFLRQMMLVIALVVNQTQNSYPGTIHSLEICRPPLLLDMFIARLALCLFPEKSRLQHRSKVDWLSWSHSLLRSKSCALWDLSAMATFGEQRNWY